MPGRRANREHLEVYLTTILLVARPILLFGGLLLFVYAAAALVMYPVGSGVALLLSVFLILLTRSYRFTLIVARFGARLATLGQRR